MGSRLFDEIREQRGLAYSVHSVPHAYADVPVLQLSAGLESSQVRRGLPADARDRERAARAWTDRVRGRARPRVRRRRPGDRVREHRRRRALRRPADDRLPRGRRSGPHDRAARRGHASRTSPRSPGGSPTSCRSPSSDRTRWRSWRRHKTGDCSGGASSRSRSRSPAAAAAAVTPATIRRTPASRWSHHRPPSSPAALAGRSGAFGPRCSGVLRRAGPATGAEVYDLTAGEHAVRRPR